MRGMTASYRFALIPMASVRRSFDPLALSSGFYRFVG
jgi:hypothetical protein